MKEAFAQIAGQAATSTSDFNPLWIIAAIAVGSTFIVIGKWIGAVNKDRTDFNKLAKDIRKDLKRILRALQQPVTVEKGSPLQLTDIGQKIADQLQAEIIVHDLAEAVSSEVVGKDEYEIQEWCFDYMGDEFNPSDTIEAKIKKSAYENGIDRDQVLYVLAVMLRDRIISGQSRQTVIASSLDVNPNT